MNGRKAKHLRRQARMLCVAMAKKSGEPTPQDGLEVSPHRVSFINRPNSVRAVYRNLKKGRDPYARPTR